LKESPWEAVVNYALSEDEIFGIPVNVLYDMREALGYSEEKYEKYIPR